MRLHGAAARPETTVTVWVFGSSRASLETLAERVAAAGGAVRRRSRWLHAVSANVPGSSLLPLARSPLVRRVQPVLRFVAPPEPLEAAPDLRPPPSGAAAADPGFLADTSYGPGAWAARQLNVPAVHVLGARGAGVRIALLDAGFNTLHPLMARTRVVAQRDFVFDDSVVRDEADDLPGAMSHGTATWSLIAADAPGRLLGVAPQAEFLLAKTEDVRSERRVEEDNWVAAIEWADSLGVDIISSSLSYLVFDDGFRYSPSQLNGDFAVTTIAADSAAQRGILVVVSAGNEGPDLATLGTPADADSVVTVGATDSLGQVVGFSSRGPTADKRIKPEVVAPGHRVVVAARDTGLMVGSGTSFSAPLVAGVAALAQGGRPGGPASRLRQGLIGAASRRLDPDNARGYGIPDALKLYAFPSGLETAGPPGTVLSSITPSFTWHAGFPPIGIGAYSFTVRLASDPALARRILDTTLSESRLTVPRALRPNTRVFWSVIARSPLGAQESSAVAGPLLIPSWVSLLTLNAPAGHTIRESRPLFRWRPAEVTSPPGPFRYDLVVYPAALDPSRPVLAVSGLTDTLFQPSAPLERNLPLIWRVTARLTSGDTASTTSQGTFVIVDDLAPQATLLFQNFPNPFPNPALGLATTCIWFDIAEAGPVRLEIFDLRGRPVRRLVPGPDVPPVLRPGRYGRAGEEGAACDPRFAWDGRDEEGAPARPGVYLYRLSAPGFRDVKRLVFLGTP